MATDEKGHNKALKNATRRLKTVLMELTATSSFVSTFDSATGDVNGVRVRIESLNDLSDRYELYQTEIEGLDDQVSDDQRISERVEFKNQLFSVKAALMRLLDTIQENQPSSPSVSVLTRYRTESSMKLPPINAPTFNGDWQKWTSFIDSFNAMFHHNSSLAPVQRLHYLKSCLDGQASDVIRSIPTTGENYLLAYNTLVNRYENKGAIIQSHIRSLFETSRVQNPSASELQILHHHITSNVNALKALEQPVEFWDAWLVTLICNRMDSSTVGEWQLQYNKKELPSFPAIETFLVNRIAAYEAGEINSCTTVTSKGSAVTKYKQPIIGQNERKIFFTKSNESKTKCVACNFDHYLFQCNKFKNLSIKERRETVFNNRLCFNCLKADHQARQCKSSSCTQCNKRHNTLLHLNHEEPVRDNTPGNHESQSVQDSVSVSPNVVGCGIVDRTLQTQSNVQVILATAVVHVYDAAGNMKQCRAVLDSGSQLCFITNKMARRLGLHIINNTVPITGIGQSKAAVSKCCVGTVHSRINQKQFQLQFHVLPSITDDLPTQTFNSNQFKIPDNIQTDLADPNFNKSGTVDILLGAEIFFDILKRNKHMVSTHTAFQDTALGWILVGKVSTPTSMFASVHPSICQLSALSLVTSTVSSRQCEEEEIVEQHFIQTTTRNEKGQFTVRLPLKDHPSCIGNTSMIAKKRFLNLENKLVKNSALANEYDEFLMEYLKLGHMEQGGHYYDDQAKGYYIPHHAVFKGNSITTKTRVVFDASAIGSSGKSLNDILMKGPVVQPTLYSTLLRFRIHQIALTADIEKMYRQILVHSDDCQLQKIIYRSKPTNKLQEFILKTVTYGTKTAPYLATRCLVELGKTCNDSEISQIIQRDFYVDDLLTGADTIEACHNIYQKLTNILTSAQLPLRKWCSNSSTLLSWLPTTTDASYLLSLSESDSVGTLGLLWQPSTDSFCYSMKPWTPPKRMTKRSLLSDINSIYDPLGLITPIMIKGKIFVQQLWYLKVNWDDKLSEDLCSRWERFYLNLQQLNKLTVPRKVIRSDSVVIQIHGFCDASQLAFGTCLYLRTIARDGSVSVYLYTSKSRVAPMKATTIPRLELCGAVLLTDLITEVQTELSQLGITVPSDNIFLWSDSTIVLAWITSQCIFHVYVANRIARIQDLTNTNQWHHVPTNANPADLISRGVEVQALSESSLWWHGPPWLSQDPTSWPNCPVLPTEVPETKPVKLVLSAQQAANELISKYSNWNRLVRITGWIMRFCNNAKIHKHQQDLRSAHHLSLLELKTARMIWIRQAQRQSFQRDMDILSKGNRLSGSSKLRSLHPFIDSDGLIHVGGRLSNSTYSNSRKYPVVLPSDHLITKLIFKSEHERLLHIGPQGLLANIHIQYWPLRGRILARSTVHKCIICFRASPVTSAPMMAPLPRERVTVARPFAHTGVDFCGPISIRSGMRRVSAVKGYIAVFVCFVTRAIHLEVVSNLTTEAFLAALERFIARRGICAHIYSDQGTNFIGANKILQTWFKTSTDRLTIQEKAATKGIEWHFNPPSSPHLGGLWEAAVKSAKKHLSKICHSALLTFEETVTLLCRIEAILNSRPLTPLSNDPSDFNALTPAHFLVGESLVFPPEPEIVTNHVNHIKRWSLVKKMYQEFWKRWQLEYLPQLQRRNKWFNPDTKVAVGDLALLKEDNMAVMTWNLVRVEAVHSGPDGTVRVVTVRNPNGTLLKRPMVKIAVLPTTQESTI